MYITHFVYMAVFKYVEFYFVMERQPIEYNNDTRNERNENKNKVNINIYIAQQDTISTLIKTYKP